MAVKFSIVIAAYNVGRFVAEAVESALEQEGAETEVIVVDDGSTDETPQALGRFAGRIRLIRQENQGVSAARNRGIREAGAEWIAFLDADDLILWGHTTIHLLEKTAFYDGFYKAFGFGPYPCIFCEHCVAEEQPGPVDESIRRLCRHMDLVRPSMEAAGMDVFATAKNAGWDLSTIPCKDLEYGKIVHGDIVSIGLVLLE